MIHPTGRHPEIINILALGPTNADYHTSSFNYNPIVPDADETWSLNKGFRTQDIDLCFILDDLIGESRKSERYYRDIRNESVPIITTITDMDVMAAYPDNNLTAFPYWEIIDLFGEHALRNRALQRKRRQNRHYEATETLDRKRELLEVPDMSPKEIREAGLQVAGYMRNSIPMILGYAAYIGVETIHLFGADYDFPGSAAHEAEKPNCEYWVGLIRGIFGVNIRMSARSTLCCTNQPPWVYGYGARQPINLLPGMTPP